MDLPPVISQNQPSRVVLVAEKILAGEADHATFGRNRNNRRAVRNPAFAARHHYQRADLQVLCLRVADSWAVAPSNVLNSCYREKVAGLDEGGESNPALSC